MEPRSLEIGISARNLQFNKLPRSFFKLKFEKSFRSRNDKMTNIFLKYNINFWKLSTLGTSCKGNNSYTVDYSPYGWSHVIGLRKCLGNRHLWFLCNSLLFVKMPLSQTPSKPLHCHLQANCSKCMNGRGLGCAGCLRSLILWRVGTPHTTHHTWEGEQPAWGDVQGLL